MSNVSPERDRVQQQFAEPTPPDPGPELGAFDAAGWADGDYDPPPTTPAGVAVAPMPCRRPTPAEQRDPRQFVYTLCVVQVLVDRDDPADPDYIADGQAMRNYAYLSDAREAADDYAECPERLDLILVPGVTHIVVNDWRGHEHYRIKFHPGTPARPAA